MAQVRFYYKAKNGKGYLNLKSPLSEAELENYEQIDAEEFARLTYVEPYVPSENEKAIAAKEHRIAYLKGELAKTDYVALKLAEGETTKNGEYKSVFENRVVWRAEINTLESEIAELKNSQE